MGFYKGKNIRTIIKSFASLFLICLFALLSGCAQVRVISKTSFFPPQAPAAGRPGETLMVRVALAQNAGEVSVACAGAVRVLDSEKSALLLTMPIPEGAKIFMRNGYLIFGRQLLNTRKIRLAPPDGGVVSVNGIRYRGQIEIIGNSLKNTCWVVDHLPIEEYLQGVVANEMRYTWPREALKAQAVAARTFTFYKIVNQARELFDLEASTNSQVYRGLDSERESTTRAVIDTSGQVMVYQGRLISAFYHSNCGGHTADVRDVWGNDIAYLRGAACGFCDRGAHFAWSLSLTAQELERRLQEHNIPAAGVRGLEICGQGADQRVKQVIIKHSGGQEILAAAAFRMVIGPEDLKSTHFDVRQGDGKFVFTGRGWGHGVGLCQEGAAGMALAGWDYPSILGHYYPGVEIRRLE